MFYIQTKGHWKFSTEGTLPVHVIGRNQPELHFCCEHLEDSELYNGLAEQEKDSSTGMESEPQSVFAD